MELVLDRSTSEQRLFPAMNLAASGTRHEDLLYDRVQDILAPADSPTCRHRLRTLVATRPTCRSSRIHDECRAGSTCPPTDLQPAPAAVSPKRHLKKRTRDHETMAMLAHVNFTIGQLQEAERVLSRAISLDAKRADYQALMAEILTNSGRHREALARYDRALKIHGSFEGAIAGKAETYLRMGKPDKALKFLDGVDTPVDDTPLLAIVKARTLIRLEQFESARSPGHLWQLNQEHRRSLGSPPHSPNAPAILNRPYLIPFPRAAGTSRWPAPRERRPRRSSAMSRSRNCLDLTVLTSPRSSS